MGWVKLDDGFFRHPKALAAGQNARLLAVVAMCWSGQYMTDGAIPANALAALAFDAGLPIDDAQAAADRLVETRLWERDADGWTIHGWDPYQTTRAEREKKQQANRDRQRRYQERKRAGTGATDTPEASRRDSRATNALVTHPESESESDKNYLPKSSVSQGGVGGTTDGRTDGRVEVIADDIARRRHLAAVAAGEVKRTPAKHLESCRVNALTELGDAIAAALEAGRTPGDIADDHAPPDPTASRSAAARARRNGAT
jgi:hypothetical protein